MQAPVKAVLEIRDEGDRMQGAFAMGKLEKLGATEKMLEQPRYNLDLGWWRGKNKANLQRHFYAIYSS